MRKKVGCGSTLGGQKRQTLGIVPKWRFRACLNWGSPSQWREPPFFPGSPKEREQPDLLHRYIRKGTFLHASQHAAVLATPVQVFWEKTSVSARSSVERGIPGSSSLAVVHGRCQRQHHEVIGRQFRNRHRREPNQPEKPVCRLY